MFPEGQSVLQKEKSRSYHYSWRKGENYKANKSTYDTKKRCCLIQNTFQCQKVMSLKQLIVSNIQASIAKNVKNRSHSLKIRRFF